ncbi:small GTPase superfamily, Ras type, partial [Kipferlia bialata]
NAQVAVIVYDITSRPSFQRVKTFVRQLNHHLERESVLIVVCGNKGDLEEQREVPKEEALEYVDEIGALYHETSCLSGQGVADMFDTIFDHMPLHEDEEDSLVDPIAVSQSGSGCPC